MTEKRELLLSLDAKVSIAEAVIEDAFSHYRRPVVVWSGGKDSTVVLNLVRSVCESRGMKMPPSLFIDHGDHYPETLEILNKVSRDWNFKIIFARNDDLLKSLKDGSIEVADLNEENKLEVKRIGFEGGEFEYSLETDVGNHLLKTVAMNNTIKRYRFDALLTGVRWDENDARGSEVFISPRDEPPHVRVQPILPMLEKDIWDYIFKNKLPIHPKYYEGYRSIDGIHDSKKVSDKPAWEQDLDQTKERAGRSQDKEGMMEKLRALGYM